MRASRPDKFSNCRSASKSTLTPLEDFMSLIWGFQNTLRPLEMPRVVVEDTEKSTTINEVTVNISLLRFIQGLCFFHPAVNVICKL
jgi:hypothetical protein